MKFAYYLFLTSFLLLSCASKDLLQQNVSKKEYQIGAYLWFQTSGEYRALCYQAYHLAKLKLDDDLRNKSHRKPHKLRAVVFDIDETVLDNSAGGAYDIKHNIPWKKENFNRWVSLIAASAVPGAKDFILYALSKKVEVLFVSNRLDSQKDDTLEMFKRLEIPAKKENFYFLTDEWSKEKRRMDILSKYHVVLFLGDNLGDFHKDWDAKKAEDRRALADLHKEDFGEKFIVFPNPLYGDWEERLPKTQNKVDLLKTIP